jgi:sugar lactone lactonase YvrE
MTKMKTHKTTHKMKDAVYSGSMALTLAVIIGAAMFTLPTTAWSQTSEWTVYNTANSGLPYNGVTSLAIDAQGNLWIGTGIFGGYTGGGLAMFDGANWTVYNTSNSELPHNDLPVLTIDSQGDLWIGTDTGGMAKFDGANWTVYRAANSGMPDDRVYGLAFDTQGNLWIGTYGLVKFDGTKWTVYNTSNSGLPSNLTTCVVIDSQDNIWIGTWDRGVAKFDGVNWTVYNTANSGLPSNTIWDLAIDTQGNLWIATDDGGVAKFGGANWTVYNTGNSGLPTNTVHRFGIGSRGDVWMGTNAGLAKFDGESWTVYNTSNSGLPHATVWSVAFDAQENILIGTRGGLAVFRPRPPVDLNADKKVNFRDLCMLAQYWHQEESPFGNHSVDYEYLAVLAEYWLTDFRLVAHWKLDEAEGTIAYDSIGSNDGILNGDPNWQPTAGKVDGALKFNGIDNYINTDFVLNPVSGSFSAFAWVKGVVPGQAIISQANRSDGRFVHPGSTWLGTDPSDGRLLTNLMDAYFPPLESESVITDSQWHHVGLVYDLDNFHRHLYVDGVEVAKDTDIVGGASSEGGLYIGAGKDLGVTSFFSGLIDDVRIYNVALSAKEIEELAR